MAGKKPLVINGREFAILKLLWEHGPSTVREIRERLCADEEIPYTTVLSLVQLMEQKEYLRHKAEGKTYRYSARVQRRRMTGQLLRDFIHRFFDDSPEALIMGLNDSSVVDMETWEQLKEEIRNSEETSDE